MNRIFVSTVFFTRRRYREETRSIIPDGRNATGVTSFPSYNSRFENIGTTNARVFQPARVRICRVSKKPATRDSGTKRLRVAFVEKHSLPHHPSARLLIAAATVHHQRTIRRRTRISVGFSPSKISFRVPRFRLLARRLPRGT